MSVYFQWSLKGQTCLQTPGLRTAAPGKRPFPDQSVKTAPSRSMLVVGLTWCLEQRPAPLWTHGPFPLRRPLCLQLPASLLVAKCHFSLWTPPRRPVFLAAASFRRVANVAEPQEGPEQAVAQGLGETRQSATKREPGRPEAQQGPGPACRGPGCSSHCCRQSLLWAVGTSKREMALPLTTRGRVVWDPG